MESVKLGFTDTIDKLERGDCFGSASILKNGGLKYLVEKITNNPNSLDAGEVRAIADYTKTIAAREAIPDPTLLAYAYAFSYAVGIPTEGLDEQILQRLPRNKAMDGIVSNFFATRDKLIDLIDKESALRISNIAQPTTVQASTVAVDPDIDTTPIQGDFLTDDYTNILHQTWGRLAKLTRREVHHAQRVAEAAHAKYPGCGFDVWVKRFKEQFDRMPPTKP